MLIARSVSVHPGAIQQWDASTTQVWLFHVGTVIVYVYISVPRVPGMVEQSFARIEGVSNIVRRRLRIATRERVAVVDMCTAVDRVSLCRAIFAG
mgnify:CR=1 FL=1